MYSSSLFMLGLMVHLIFVNAVAQDLTKSSRTGETPSSLRGIDLDQDEHRNLATNEEIEACYDDMLLFTNADDQRMYRPDYKNLVNSLSEGKLNYEWFHEMDLTFITIFYSEATKQGNCCLGNNTYFEMSQEITSEFEDFVVMTCNETLTRIAEMFPPTASPTMAPTLSGAPSETPSSVPTVSPTSSPTSKPTAAPSSSPVETGTQQDKAASLDVKTGSSDSAGLGAPIIASLAGALALIFFIGAWRMRRRRKDKKTGEFANWDSDDSSSAGDEVVPEANDRAIPVAGAFPAVPVVAGAFPRLSESSSEEDSEDSSQEANKSGILSWITGGQPTAVSSLATGGAATAAANGGGKWSESKDAFGKTCYLNSETGDIMWELPTEQAV